MSYPLHKAVPMLLVVVEPFSYSCISPNNFEDEFIHSLHPLVVSRVVLHDIDESRQPVCSSGSECFVFGL
jgi:hypothetical protein